MPHRRLPVRSRTDVRTDVLQRRPAVVVSRRDPPDPVLSRVKLIAEPWDVGPAATRSATSPCCGRSGTPNTATRSATSGERRPRSRRSPSASPGRVISEDGAARRPRSTSSRRTTASRSPTSSPTTRSTTRRIREKSRQKRRNRSWNCGIEGPTADPRSRRFALAGAATCSPRFMLSQGTPMLLGETRSLAPSRATTTARARTTGTPGFDFAPLTMSSAPSRSNSSPCAAERHVWRSSFLAGDDAAVRHARRGLAPRRRGGDDRGGLAA